VNDVTETSCHRLVHRTDDRIVVTAVCDDEKEGNRRRVEVANIAMPRYLICYKPRGVVCSSRRNEGIDRADSVLISDWLANVRSFDSIGSDGRDEGDDLRCDNRSVFDKTNAPSLRGGGARTIKTVGRLDEESEGLILLTNDGSFSRLLCDPEFGLKKTYRVVVRGSGYSRLTDPKCYVGDSSDDHEDGGENDERRSSLRFNNNRLATKVAEMIKCGNQAPSRIDDDRPRKQKKATTKPHFPYQSCRVIDAGKLPNQHASDDSYYAIVDLVLREGKRHMVRRIIKNAGADGLRLRVCYLSRIAIEGLEAMLYDVVKPDSIVEAMEGGFLPVDGERHCKMIPPSKLVFRPQRDDHDGGCVICADSNCSILLNPGDVMELRGCDVDRMFGLR